MIASCLQQVLGSFIIFEITWPDVVLSGIEFLKNAGDFIQIDLLEIPGLACPWASYSYETKFHVSMATPLVISVMLTMPVPVAWFLARQDEKKRNLHQNSQSVDVEITSAEEDYCINWRLRYEKTVNTCMNNIMCVHSCYLLVEPLFLLTVKACVHVLRNRPSWLLGTESRMHVRQVLGLHHLSRSFSHHFTDVHVQKDCRYGLSQC